MVETALVLPLILAILMGILDFGRALNYWNDTNQLAADGARYAAVGINPGPGATLADSIAARAETAELRNGTGSVTAPLRVCVSYPEGAAVGKPVKVRVRSAFRLIPIVHEGPPVGIAGEATMRVERIPPGGLAGGAC